MGFFAVVVWELFGAKWGLVNGWAALHSVT